MSDLLQQCAYLSSTDQTRIQKATELCILMHQHQLRADGSTYSSHPIAVAKILASWHADAETIIAGLLHDTLEDTTLTPHKIEQEFGTTVLMLVEGVTKFNTIDFAGNASLDRKVETLRKLFDVMRQDIRVVVIKLADRLHNVRTIDALNSERQQKFAKETLQTFYRLAYHLGMNDVRRELSDRCFPIIHPKLSSSLQKKREHDIAHINSILKPFINDLQQHDDTKSLVNLYVHPRSLQSMSEEHGNVREGYVIIAIARDRDACYDLLKVLHTQYQPISGTFEDHIAVPAESSYQSIRTSILGPEGHIIPLRIRTEEMEDQEKHGILLKLFGDTQTDVPGFSWLTQSKQIDETTKQSSEAFWDALQRDIFQKRIRVVVDGEDIFISSHATVLDAVYARHETNAHRLCSITKNSHNAKLSEPVCNGDVLHATLKKQKRCKHDWLQLVNTRFARSLIVQTLKERTRKEKISIGRQLLQKEFDYFHQGVLSDLSEKQTQPVIENVKRQNFDDILAMIGEGSLEAKYVFIQLFPQKKDRSLQKKKPPKHSFCVHVHGERQQRSEILPQLSTLAGIYEVNLDQTRIAYQAEDASFSLSIRGSSSNRIQYAHFLDALLQQHWIREVEPGLVVREKWLLGLSIGIPIVTATTSFILSRYLQSFLQQSLVSLLLLCFALAVPVFIGNIVQLRLLRTYFVRLRRSEWVVSLGILLNIVTVGFLSLILAQNGHNIGAFPFTILSILFILLLVFISVFMSTFTQGNKKQAPLSKEEWQGKMKEKIIGYALRISAVVIWGLTPIIARYGLPNTPATFNVSFSFLLSSFIFVPIALVLHFYRGGASSSTKEAYSASFWIAILFNAGTVFFIFLGARNTIAANTELFLNFAPVIGLLITFIWLRKKVPYLQTASTARWFFLSFIAGTFGTALLIGINIPTIPQETKLLGDSISFLAVITDVIATLALIHYAKQSHAFAGFSYIVRRIGFLALLFFPIVLHHREFIPLLTEQEWMVFLYYAIFDVCLAYLFGYLAFKRLDGLIAYLLFNLSSVVTVLVETIFFNLPVSLTFFIGATLIIGASITAEIINSRCEKQGL